MPTSTDFGDLFLGSSVRDKRTPIPLQAKYIHTLDSLVDLNETDILFEQDDGVFLPSPLKETPLESFDATGCILSTGNAQEAYFPNMVACQDVLPMHFTISPKQVFASFCIPDSPDSSSQVSKPGTPAIPTPTIGETQRSCRRYPRIHSDNLVQAYSLEASGISNRKRPRAILPDVVDSVQKAPKIEEEAPPAPSVLRLYAPRPPNAFILYRRHYYSRLAAENPHLATQDISRKLGELWKKEAPQIKMRFKQMALEVRDWNEERYKDLPKRRRERRVSCPLTRFDTR